MKTEADRFREAFDRAPRLSHFLRKAGFETGRERAQRDVDAMALNLADVERELKQKRNRRHRKP